jgi:hypothetical protein
VSSCAVVCTTSKWNHAKSHLVRNPWCVSVSVCAMPCSCWLLQLPLPQVLRHHASARPRGELLVPWVVGAAAAAPRGGHHSCSNVLPLRPVSAPQCLCNHIAQQWDPPLLAPVLLSDRSLLQAGRDIPCHTSACLVGGEIACHTHAVYQQADHMQ